MHNVQNIARLGLGMHESLPLQLERPFIFMHCIRLEHPLFGPPHDLGMMFADQSQQELLKSELAGFIPQHTRRTYHGRRIAQPTSQFDHGKTV